MKKLLLLTCINVFIIASIFAQTDTISTNIYQENGNLGIGTANPDSQFEMVCNEPVNYLSFGIFSIKNNHYASFDSYSASDLPHVASLLNGRKSRGTLLYPENIQENDRLTGIISAMYYNNEFHFNSSIEFYSGEGLGTYSFPSYISFKTTGKNEIERSERMRLSEKGNLGIGTDSPLARLHISDGDIYIEDINRGIIMKSPNGQCWKGTMDNSGTLVFNLIDCPQIDTFIDQQENLNDEINIFPNPTNSKLNIEILNENLNDLNYYISNSAGQLIEKGRMVLIMNEIDISHFSRGLYLITITDKSGISIASKKIIKEH